MRPATALKYLLPHGIATLGFLLAFAWMAHVGSNRTLPDLYLALAGYAASLAALAASLLFLVKFLRQPGARSCWPWLLVHAAALVLVVFLGVSWFGYHLA